MIAVSASRDVVSLYLDGAKYILEHIPVVLAKANQALATLDKYRSRLDQVSTRLTALEFEGGVTLHDVLTALQRAELVTRMAVEIERYIVELGTEGRLIEMQLEETMVGVAGAKAALVHDYLADYSEESFALVVDSMARLPHQDLLDFGRLAELLGYERKLNTLDHPVSPSGYRILGRDTADSQARDPGDRARIRRAGRDPGGHRRRAGGRRGSGGHAGEGDSRGSSPPTGDQPRGSISANLIGGAESATANRRKPSATRRWRKQHGDLEISRETPHIEYEVGDSRGVPPPWGR